MHHEIIFKNEQVIKMFSWLLFLLFFIFDLRNVYPNLFLIISLTVWRFLRIPVSSKYDLANFLVDNSLLSFSLLELFFNTVY